MIGETDEVQTIQDHAKIECPGDVWVRYRALSQDRRAEKWAVCAVCGFERLLQVSVEVK